MGEDISPRSPQRRAEETAGFRGGMHVRDACWIFGVVACGVLSGCASQGKPAVAVEQARDAMAAHFHFREHQGDAARGWVILLPGASGLTIFEDKEHYFRAAERMTREGFDVVVVDYKAAYHAAADRPDVETGEKIAWVTERAAAWLREAGHAAPGEAGFLVGWSLGGEGVWTLLASPERVRALGLRGAAMYYPANEGKLSSCGGVPLLVMTGGADDVVPASEVRATAEAARAQGCDVALEVYPGAQHGFDVESLKKMRVARLLPLVGPKATFQFDAGAAADAEGKLIGFLMRCAQ